MWVVVHHLNQELSSSLDKQESNHNSEWGPEAAEAMCNDVRHLTIPGGNGSMTMGDLIDRTPKDLISKVMLEEKVFDTWYGDRVVLIGDAVHKFDPAVRSYFAYAAKEMPFALVAETNSMICSSPRLHRVVQVTFVGGSEVRRRKRDLQLCLY